MTDVRKVIVDAILGNRFRATTMPAGQDKIERARPFIEEDVDAALAALKTNNLEISEGCAEHEEET